VPVSLCIFVLSLRNGIPEEPLAQSGSFISCGAGGMKKAARTTKRAPISRAQQIFSIRRRLAFLHELEGRLKEQAAVLDAHKPSRRSPSRLPELFDSPALLFRRSVNPKVVQLLPGAKLRH